VPEVRAIQAAIIDYLVFRSGFPAILEVSSANRKLSGFQGGISPVKS
jgi:hypothetical protein